MTPADAGHTEHVVFLETRLRLVEGGIIPEYISVDASGVILTWQYVQANFTGCD